MRKAVITVASNKYLAKAVVALESFLKFNSGWDAWLLLADEPQGFFKPEALGFPLISVDELQLPEARKYQFRYTEKEFSISLKSRGILNLLENKSYDRVIYLDADVCCYGPMSAAERALDTGVQILLSPHLLWGSRKGTHLVEGDILKGGAYNLGFLGLNKGPESLAMLHWLADILVTRCVLEAWNTSRDQKWIDLLPGMFESYKVLRDPGYNVASWNLQERDLKLVDGVYHCHGERLAFFHFSSYDPSKPTKIKKHQDGVDYEDMGEAKRILTDYGQALKSSPWAACAGWAYAYGRFSDGSPITESMRARYRDQEDLQQRCGDDPFSRPQFFKTPNFFQAVFMRLAALLPPSLRFAILPPFLRKRIRRLLNANIEA